MIEQRFPIFQERFYLLRQEKGLSQDEFAKFLELSRPTVGFYENGTRIPDILGLRKIAEKCEVSADWLVGLTDVSTNDTDLKSICSYTGLSEKAVKTIRENDDFLLYMHVINYFIEMENFENLDDSLCLFSNICGYVFNLTRSDGYYYYQKGKLVKTKNDNMPLTINIKEVFEKILLDRITTSIVKAREKLMLEIIANEKA